MSNTATGPRSDEGKEHSSLNAVKHGLRSERPVLPCEDAGEWDAFRQGILHDLDPATTLERELAERVALQLWRLRRAARYETQVAADDEERARHAAHEHLVGRAGDSVGQELLEAVRLMEQAGQQLGDAQTAQEVARQLPTLPAATPVAVAVALGLLTLAGKPELTPEAPTAGALRRLLALACDLPAAEALRKTLGRVEERCRQLSQQAADRLVRVELLRREREREGRARQHESWLLQSKSLDRVVRYEAHVSRQLNQALTLLRQFKEERRACDALAGAAGSGQTPAVAAAEPAVGAAPVAAPSAAVATGSFGNRVRVSASVAPRHEQRSPSEDGAGADSTVGAGFVRPFAPAGVPCTNGRPHGPS